MAILGSLNPKYFYIDDNGEIKKLVYCRLCHAGPFKEIEDRVNFMFFGFGKRDPFCIACATAHNYFQPVPQKRVDEDEDKQPKSPFKEPDILDL